MIHANGKSHRSIHAIATCCRSGELGGGLRTNPRDCRSPVPVLDLAVMKRAIDGETWVVAFLLALGAMLRWSHLAGDSAAVAMQGPLIDDSYYYFGIARNIVSGLGVTHDGIHPTAGFHPVWMAMLVPVFAVFHGDIYQPVVAALHMQALLAIVTGWLLYRVARNLAGPAGAVFPVMLWAVSPPFVLESINGLETGLACIALIGGIWLHISRVVSRDGLPSLRSAIAVGAFYGFMVLCRLDLGIAVAVLGMHWTLMAARRLLRRNGQGALALRRLAAATVMGIAILGPWLAFVHHQTGGWLPESGVATRTVALAYGTRPGNSNTEYVDMERPPPQFYAQQGLATVREVLTRPAWWPVSAVTTSLRELFRFPRTSHGLAALGGALALAWFTWRIRQRRRPHADATGPTDAAVPANVLGPLVIALSAATMAAYSLYVFGSWWFSRYYTPLLLLWALYSAMPVQRAIDAVATRTSVGKARLLAALAGSIVLAWAVGGREARMGILNPTLPYWQAARIAESTLPPSARLGAFQSGTLGYAMNRPVVNLDGVVNVQAFAAIRDGRVLEYILEEGIDCIMDWPNVIEALLVRRSELLPGVRLRLIAQGTMDIYCIERDSTP